MSTRHNVAGAMRHTLRWLWRFHGAPLLDDLVVRPVRPRPRNVTATEVELQQLVARSDPQMRLFVLLCADLAIRSGTAVNLGPANYDPGRRTLTFRTKMSEAVTLPVTEELRGLIERCDMRDPKSFYKQLSEWWTEGGKPAAAVHRGTLSKRWITLLKQCGITRRLTPHDLRRTAAVAMYQQTHDMRDVQSLLGHANLTSTAWYLDHDARPVSRELLELIKSPARRSA